MKKKAMSKDTKVLQTIYHKKDSKFNMCYSCICSIFLQLQFPNVQGWSIQQDSQNISQQAAWIITPAQAVQYHAHSQS